MLMFLHVRSSEENVSMENKDISEIPIQMTSTPVKRRMSFMDMNPQTCRPKSLRLQELNGSLPAHLMSTSLNLTTFDNFVAYRGRFQKVLNRRRRFSSVLPLRERFDKALETRTRSADNSITKRKAPSPIDQLVFDEDSKFSPPRPAVQSMRLTSVLTLTDASRQTEDMSCSSEDEDGSTRSKSLEQGRSLFSVSIHSKENLERHSPEDGSTCGGQHDIDALESSIIGLDENELRYVHGCSSALLAASASKDQRNSQSKPFPAQVPFHTTYPSSQKNNICDFPTYRFCFEFMKAERLSDSRFGLVFAARNRIDGTFYCIKKSRGSGDIMCEKDKMADFGGPLFHEAREEILEEIKVLASLPLHENVIRYYSSWIEYDCVYIQLEYCTGGSLLEYLQPHPAGNTLVRFRLLQLMGDIGSAVHHLNENGMVHLDLTPGNVLVQSPTLCRTSSGLDLSDQKQNRRRLLEGLMGDPKERLIFKLADFGRCRRHSQSDIFDEVGDPRFMPPEVYGGINGANNNDVDVFKIDVFSLGMTLYCAMGGEPIARNYEDPNQLLYKRMRRPSYADSQIFEFVQRMMMPIHQRPSIDSVLDFPGVCEASWSHQCLRRRINLLSKRNAIKKENF